MHRLVLLLTLAASAAAQPARLSGTVHDAEGEPLPGANVYLSGTTRGDATDADGRFEIADLEPGAYRVVASMVGFVAATAPVSLAAGDDVRLSLQLEPRALAEATVEAERDARWERRLARFTREILGTSARADSTRLLNPWVLDFRSRWGTLTATASAPLLIENRALGYRLRYDLHAFSASDGRVSYDGDEQFAELTPDSPETAARWDREREAAYRGSLPHLLQSLLQGTADAEGYTFVHVFEDRWGGRGSGTRFPVPADGLVRTDSAGWGSLRIRGQLEVAFPEPEDSAYLQHPWFRETRSRPAPVQRSALHLTGFARFDPRGIPEDPFAISTSGYFGFERLADALPAEYEPPAPSPDGSQAPPAGG